jgi:hypothetical protein
MIYMRRATQPLFEMFMSGLKRRLGYSEETPPLEAARELIRRIGYGTEFKQPDRRIHFYIVTIPLDKLDDNARMRVEVGDSLKIYVTPEDCQIKEEVQKKLLAMMSENRKQGSRQELDDLYASLSLKKK